MDQIYTDKGDVPGFDEKFGARFSSIIELTGSLKEASRVAGYTSEQIARWRDGRAKPSLFAVMALAAATGVSLDWLATGEGPMFLSEREDGQGVGDGANLDIDLLWEIVEELERFCAERKCCWSPEKKARLIAAAYVMMLDSSAEDDRTDVASLRFLLEAAAE